MAAKTDFKALMLAKGEKFLLLGAIAIGALLLLWGVISAFAKIDPTDGKKQLDQGSQGLKRKLDSDEAPPTEPKKPLPEYPPIPVAQFRVPVSYPFEPTVWPDRFRQLPEALPPIDSQIDLFLCSIRKHGRDNFKYDDEGNLVDFSAQWITKQIDPKVDSNKIRDEIKDSLKPTKGKKPRRPGGGTPQPPGGLPGGPGGLPGGGGFGEGGLGGGGLGGGGLPGVPGVPGGQGFGEEGFGTGPVAGTKTAEDVVEWKTYSAVMESGKPAVPAFGVFPERMAVVQLSYPLEAQLKEIQRALRLPSLRHAIYESSPERLFATDPDTGKVVPYTSLATGVGAGAAGPGVPGVPGVPGGSPRPGGLGGGVGAGMGGQPGPGGLGEGGGSTTPLTADTLTSPVFAGFVVQRRVILPDGAGEWQDFDHAERYYNEFTLYDAPIKPDTGYLPYFLRLDQGMAAPMPQVAPGWTTTPQLIPGEPEPKEVHYPEYVRMPSIVADFEALQKLLKPVKKKEALDKYKKNPNNPYSTGASRTSGYGAGIPGLGGEEDTGSGVMGSGFGRPGPGVPGVPGGPGVPSTPADATKSPLGVKHMLIRFLDTDLLPGVSYQYRVAVKLRNPNFGKPKEVADVKLADIEFITSKYFQCKQTLRVPGESHLYAGSIKEYEKKVTEMVDEVKKATPQGTDTGGIAPDRLKKLFEFTEVRDGKRAVVQMQRWVQTVSFGSEEERIGAWVQTDVPVAPGEFIGRRMLVELPLWKAALGKYQLTPPTKKLEKSWPEKVPSPAGRPVDFRTRHVLMDYEGGKVKASVDGRTVDDEAATELLILRDDGRLEVRKELADAVLPERVARDKNWTAWIAEVRKAYQQAVGGTNPGGFDPGRGGPGPGGPGGPGSGGPPGPPGGGR